MSSNIPLINPIEDKIQDEDMAQNKVTSLEIRVCFKNRNRTHRETKY